MTFLLACVARRFGAGVNEAGASEAAMPRRVRDARSHEEGASAARSRQENMKSTPTGKLMLFLINYNSSRRHLFSLYSSRFRSTLQPLERLAPQCVCVCACGGGGGGE